MPLLNLMRAVLVLGLLFIMMTGPGAASGMPRQAVPDSISAMQLRMALLYPNGLGAQVQVPLARAAGQRSVPLAFVLSAAVPGLGQAYNRDWIKAAVGVALEAAFWTGVVVWNRRGHDAVDAYQDFAHQGWSPLRYAHWLNDFRDFRGSSAPAVDVARYSGIDFTQPDRWTDADRRAMQALFDEIRELERVMTHATGASFSHMLPYFAEQQYYELIGKYYQFGPGWEDYTAWRDDEGNFTAYIDPTKEHVSDDFAQYSRDHAHANDLLRRATRVTGLVLLTHVVAAMDAAISARLHNKRVQAAVEMRQDALGQLQPVPAVRVRF